jgi:hypothetical protein
MGKKNKANNILSAMKQFAQQINSDSSLDFINATRIWLDTAIENQNTAD